jgi:hypothetical protein
MDIDRFKAINDQHGHLVGDRAITHVAATLGKHLAADTGLFRYGGEEFAVLLPGADLATAAALAETLRVAVEAAVRGREGHPQRRRGPVASRRGHAAARAGRGRPAPVRRQARRPQPRGRGGLHGRGRVLTLAHAGNLGIGADFRIAGEVAGRPAEMCASPHFGFLAA